MTRAPQSTPFQNPGGGYRERDGGAQTEILVSIIGLEAIARYGGLLLAPAKGFGLRPRLFFANRAKKEYYMVRIILAYDLKYKRIF